MPLELKLKAAYVVADRLEQHILALENEAYEKSRVGQVLPDHFAKVYKVPVPTNLFVSKDGTAA